MYKKVEKGLTIWEYLTFCGKNLQVYIEIVVV